MAARPGRWWRRWASRRTSGRHSRTPGISDLYLQQGTSDGQAAFVVKYSTDGGATWKVVEKMGIAQNVGTPFKNTWDFLVAQGYGKPETRRLPYDDYGLITVAPITGS